MKLPILLLLTILLFPALAYGLAGTETSPSLSYQSGIDAKQKEKVNKALEYMQSNLNFLEGNFINEFTFQRFGGDAKQVVHLIHLLQEVGLWKVQVQFRNFGEEKTAFTLNQGLREDQLSIIINSGRSDFSLKDFAAFIPSPQLSLLAPPQSEPAEK